MLRFLCSASAIIILVFSMCFLPRSAVARRCPVKEPETLLSLYLSSDAIYIASFDKTTTGEALDANDEYTVVTMNKHFTVSATLKGKNSKFFVLEDREYRYKGREITFVSPGSVERTEPVSVGTDSSQAESAEETIEEDDADPRELKSGDKVLLFVTNSDSEEPPQLADYRDGIKKMSGQDLSIYESRIRELNSIFSAKKINLHGVIEWLVRCAEDPVTRWEGTYELLRSFRFKRWKDEAEQERKDRIAKGLPVEENAVETDEDSEIAAAKSGDLVDRTSFARLLDANQKQTLSNILLNFASQGGDLKHEYVKGDRELIELVAKWGDPRFVGFLLDQIRNGADDNSETAENMDLVAEILKDAEIKSLSERFGETVYEEDDDSVEAVDAETEPTAEEPDGTVSEPIQKPAADDAEASEVKPIDADHQAAPARKQTYKELRVELLAKFITRCEKVIAGGSDSEGPAAKATADKDRPSNE